MEYRRRERFIKRVVILGGEALDWSLWSRELGILSIKLSCEKAKLPDREEAGCLYITDQGEMGKILKERGCAVLGLFHAGNSPEGLRDLPFIMEYTPEADAEYLERAYRRLKGIPWTILETERIWVRETVPEDVEAFWAIYREAAITRYTEGLYPTAEEERRYIQEYIASMYRFYGFGVWTILLKETGEIIGRAGFSLRKGYEEPELGFVIGLPWQKRGLCREACGAIVEYGWRELDFAGIQAFVRRENLASEAVCRSLGMSRAENVTEQGAEYTRWVLHSPETSLYPSERST